MNIRYAFAAFALLGIRGYQAPQVWEKPIVPGLTYRMEVEKEPARIIHILRMNPANGALRMEPALAGTTVYETNETKGRGTVSDIQRETNALAAINADFFPFTGDPLGLMVRGGNLISPPNPKRTAFAWGPKDYAMGRAAFYARAMSGGERLFEIDTVNEECPMNRITLNTAEAGQAISKTPCAMAILKLDGGRLPPSSMVQATVQAIVNDTSPTRISADQAILVGQGDKAETIRKLPTGLRLTIEVATSGFAWDRFDDAISGGPMIVKDGKVNVADEGNGKAFASDRHPRTAMGITAKGEWILCVVDGRQTMSVGASLPELAQIMIRQGCIDALNLDGGGSSAMNVLGMTINRPSDKGGERAVSNGLIIKGPSPRTSEGVLKIRVPLKMKVGDTAQLQLVRANGNMVPNGQIFWSAQGNAWTDGGGTLRAWAGGPAEVIAYAEGQIVRAKIDVAGSAAAPRELEADDPARKAPPKKP